MKKCTTCGINKSLEAFSLSKTAKDGRQWKCKECFKAYRKENKDRNRQAQAQWYQRNREYKQEYLRNWYLAKKAAGQ